MFSPITARSLRVRLLYIATYLLLFIGGGTVIFPFMVMVAGSVEPSSRAGDSVFPGYLFNDGQMWNRYLETKYAGDADLLRAAWNDPDADFLSHEAPVASEIYVRLWKQFLSETKPKPSFFALAFSGLRGMPSYTNRKFRLWLLRDYDNDLARLNRDLGTQFEKVTTLNSPSSSLVGSELSAGKLTDRYLEFIALQPQTRLLPIDVGGYYRAVFLPTRLGEVSAYNARNGTRYQEWSEVPFPRQTPMAGHEDWLFFVSQVLRPDFVELTPSGEAARAAEGLGKVEFIRLAAKAEHLRVTSLDTLFADWAEQQGVVNARIPQKALDRLSFDQEKGFWKWQFLTLNYQRVIDDVVLHGAAVKNTVILVGLFVVSAIVINPLAAYALSRFKLKQTYFILVFCLVTMAFPGEVTMIPVFLQLKELHLLNTFGALILPSLANGFSIFLLKGFFDSLPKELFEAAEIDGASEWTMFWQIAMTLSKPILAVMVLGAFSAAYGAFFYALILAPNPKMWTIMVYIYQLQMTVGAPVVYASLILTAIPTLLVFIFCQNMILRGIVVPTDK